MPRQTYRNFDGGLWVSGPREQTGAQFQRRLKGTHPLRVNQITSRDGSVRMAKMDQDADNILSLTRFGDMYYAVTAAGNLYKINGPAVTLMHAGLSGSRTVFGVMPPTQGAADALFLAQHTPGVELLKILGDGTVEQWGIDPPATTKFTAVLDDGLVPSKTLFDPSATTTCAANKFTIVGTAVLGAPAGADRFDTAGYGAGPPFFTMSSLSDMIQFSINCTNVPCINSILVTIEDGAGNGFSVVLLLNGSQLSFLPSSSNPQFAKYSGINQISVAVSEQVWTIINIPKSSFTALTSTSDWATMDRITLTAGTTDLAHTGSIVVSVRRVDMLGGFGITGEYGYRITYRNSTTGTRSNPSGEVRLSASSIYTPRSAVFLSSLPYTIGEIGDPQVDQVEIWRTLGGGAQWFLVDQVPLSVLAAQNGGYADVFSDVDAFNVKPTHPANGTVSTAGLSDVITLSDGLDALAIAAFINTPYLLMRDTATNKGRVVIRVTIGGADQLRTVINIGAAPNQFILDAAVDWSTAPTFTYDEPVPVVSTVALPLDNITPEVEFNDVAGPINGRLWWLSSAATKRGRAYYSPPGRAEAVEGFIELVNNTDPLTKLVVWNGALWAFSEAKVWQIVENPPIADIELASFRFQEIFGAKGTTKPFALTPTPSGIFYWAGDGVRIFDGVQSQLVAFDPLSTLFRGRNTEALAAFEADFAAARPDEYVVADAQGIAYGLRLATPSWREIGGIGIKLPGALFYDARANKLLFGIANELWEFEGVGLVNDMGAAVDFIVETPGLLVGPAKLGITSRLYIEALTNGQAITPTLVTEVGNIVLPPFQTAVRATVEYPRTQNFRILGVRLEGQLVARVEIYGIEYDYAVGAAPE